MRLRTTFLLIVGLPLFAQAVAADSLFSSQVAAQGTLVSDIKSRFELGDIITVIVQEAVDAQTDSELETEKESDVNADSPSEANETLTGENGFDLFDAAYLPNWSISASNESEAEGSTLRRTSISTTVTCLVTQVFPNGNVMLEGQKKVTVNREDSFLVVSGIARTRDVTAENVVASAQLANSVVALTGHGPLWNNQRRGFFTKLLDWFSPF